MSDKTKTELNTYVNKLTIHLGPVTAIGKLVGVPKSKTAEGKPEFHYVSPAGNRVVQRYLDEQTGEYFIQDELSTGFEREDGTMQALDSEALAEVKEAGLPVNVFNVTVHPAHEVNDQIFPSKNTPYVFYPDEEDPKNKGWADFIRTAAETEGYALLGKMRLGKKTAAEHLYRITVWRGHIVIQHQLFPSQLKPHEVVQNNVPASTRAKALGAVQQLCEPFNGDTYTDDVLTRLKEYVADAEASGVSAPPKQVSKPVEEFDLDSALDDLFAAG